MGLVAPCGGDVSLGGGFYGSQAGFPALQSALITGFLEDVCNTVVDVTAGVSVDAERSTVVLLQSPTS